MDHTCFPRHLPAPSCGVGARARGGTRRVGLVGTGLAGTDLAPPALVERVGLRGTTGRGETAGSCLGGTRRPPAGVSTSNVVEPDSGLSVRPDAPPPASAPRRASNAAAAECYRPGDCANWPALPPQRSPRQHSFVGRRRARRNCQTQAARVRCSRRQGNATFRRVHRMIAPPTPAEASAPASAPRRA